MRKFYILTLLIYLVLTPNFAGALEGGIEYDGIYIDYNRLNYGEWSTKANNYLDLANKAKTEKERQKYYSQAVGAYQTMTKIYPFDPVIMATIGHIYGKMHRPIYAKAYLDRGLNLDLKNSTVNYYYGIFMQDERDFRKARKYYNIAFANGMEYNYDLAMRLAVINAKLGELENSKYYYQHAYSIRPSKEIKDKILLLDELKK